MKPKKFALRQAEESYTLLVEGLSVKQRSLAEVEKSLEEIEFELKKIQQEKFNIENQTKECSRKLNRSYELLSSLDNERHRWKSMIEELKNREMNTIGDSLLAAGFVTYFGRRTGNGNELLIATIIQVQLERVYVHDCLLIGFKNVYHLKSQ